MTPDLVELQRATLSARERTGNAKIGVSVEGGLFAVEEVTYRKNGTSIIRHLSAPMSLPAVVAFLEGLKQ
jgi:hypothetical protein